MKALAEQFNTLKIAQTIVARGEDTETMYTYKRLLAAFVAISGILSWNIESSAQTRVLRALDFQRITGFETEWFIADMKMSADATKIVFSTGGPTNRVFTLNTDGSGLTQIFDFQRQGFGPSVDISGDGDRIVWCDGYGELYSANSDGSDVRELATLIPHPNPIWSDFEPEIPLPPRITLDGSQIFFINAIWDPLASGVWRIDSDGSNLTQLFDYLELSRDVFGRDGSEYVKDAAFSDGFSISGNGTRMIFGTRIFKLENGDLSRGDAIVLRGAAFYRLGAYATGNQPFATDPQGDNFVVFRRELNVEKGEDEINVYHTGLGTGDPVEVIGGLSVFGTARNVQLTSDGKQAIVSGGMSTQPELPISLVDGVSGSRWDLVNVDGASLKQGAFRMSLAALPSVNARGDIICFLAASNPQQIWIERLGSDGSLLNPSITGVELNPDFVSSDHTTASTFKAHVRSTQGPVQSVQFSALRNGAYHVRALSSAFPFTSMMDDGTFGDEHAGDGWYTNNDVRKDLPETPNGSYTVRIDATDGQSITAVDAEPFSIRDVSSGISGGGDATPVEFHLYQNSPNPFNPSTTIRYGLPSRSHVTLTVFNGLGQQVATLVQEEQEARYHEVKFDARNLASGVYFYRLQAGDVVQTKKLVLVK